MTNSNIDNTARGSAGNAGTSLATGSAAGYSSTAQETIGGHAQGSSLIENGSNVIDSTIANTNMVDGNGQVP